MSTPVKIGVGLVGVLLLLVVSLVILIKIMVTPEKVRETLVPLAEEALSRQVEVGEIEIGLLSGVSLNDLKVLERDSADEFISIKSLALQYQLLALLTGNLVVDQVLLDQPKISVTRYPDGSFNFSDLLGDAEPGQEHAEPDDKSTAASKPGGSVLDVLINEVSVKGGQLMFVDRLKNPKSPYRFLLNQLDFQARKITLESTFPIVFSAQLNGSQIGLSGQYDISKQSGDFELQLAALDLLQFSPYFRESLPGTLSSAQLVLKLDLKLQPNQISSTGKVLLDEVDLLLNDLPDAELKKAKLTIDHAISFQLAAKQLDISTLLIDFNGIKLGSEGSVKLSGAEPQLALALLFDKFDVSSVLKGAPEGLTKDLQAYRLAGQLDGRIELAGVPSAGAKLLKSADLKLTDVQVNVDSLQAGLSGGISLAEQKVRADKLTLMLNDQQANLSFKAANLFGDVVKGDFKITSEQLDLNRILPAAPEKEKAQKPASASKLPPVERQKTAADEIGPFDIPVDMTGQILVKKLIYKQLNLDNVTADMSLKNNHLKITKLRSGIAGGEFIASTDVNLAVKGLSYKGQMSLQQSKLVDLVSGLYPQAEQSVTGLLQWKNNFSGRGTIPDNLLKTLQVKGDFQINKGKITGSPLLEQLAGFLGSPDLKVLSFSGLKSQYDLRDGLARFSGDLDSSKAKMKPEGTVGVDGSLDMSLDARLAPEVMKNLGAKGNLQQALTDENGWGMLPLKIKGTLTSPKFGLDSKALQKQAVGKVKQEVTKKLLKKIAPTADGKDDPTKQLLEGTLKKLFGN